MRKKKLYALVGEERFGFAEDVCYSVKTEFLQFSFKRKELEEIAYWLNDNHYTRCHWRVEEVSY